MKSILNTTTMNEQELPSVSCENLEIDTIIELETEGVEQNNATLTEMLAAMQIECAKKAAPKKSKDDDDEDDDDFDDDFESDDFEGEDFDVDPDFEEFDLPKGKKGKAGSKKDEDEDFDDDFGDLNIFDDEDSFDDDDDY